VHFAYDCSNTTARAPRNSDSPGPARRLPAAQSSWQEHRLRLQDLLDERLETSRCPYWRRRRKHPQVQPSPTLPPAPGAAKLLDSCLRTCSFQILIRAISKFQIFDFKRL